MIYDEPSGFCSRAIHGLVRVLSVPARWLAHVLMLPVDAAFLLFDLFWVNLKKTPLFEEDCRGMYPEGGGPCGPAEKYTNRFLFRVVCRDLALSDVEARPICRAGDRLRIYFIRGLFAGLLVTALVVGLACAVVVLWPTPTTNVPTPEERQAAAAQSVRAGEAALAAGHCQEALDCFLEALQALPADARVRYKAGLCYEELGETARAAECFVEAARGDSAYAPAVLFE